MKKDASLGGDPDHAWWYSFGPETGFLPRNRVSFHQTVPPPDHDPLVDTFVMVPFGMSINHQYGTIRWTPRSTPVGANPVTVRISDPYGGSATQQR